MLCLMIKIHKKFGSPKIYNILLKKEIKLSNNRVVKIMKENRIKSIIKKKFFPFFGKGENSNSYGRLSVCLKKI